MPEIKSAPLSDKPVEHSPSFENIRATALLAWVAVGTIYLPNVLISSILCVIAYVSSKATLEYLKLRENTRLMRAHIVAACALTADVLVFVLEIGIGVRRPYLLYNAGVALGIIAFGLVEWRARRSYLHR